MKSLLVAVLLVGLASAQLDNVNFIQRSKRQAKDGPEKCEMEECCKNSANCGDAFCSSLVSNDHYQDLSKFANDLIIRSYEYFFLSAQFGSYTKDRPGFEKVLHGLSDGAWGKGLELIKEVAKRGSTHSFAETSAKDVTAHGEVSEFEALAKAVVIEKDLLKKAEEIHRHHAHATLKDNSDLSQKYDAGLAHFLEEEVIEDKIDTVRNLVGHVNDLKKLFKSEPSLFPLSLYLFDQHLQK